MDVFRARLVTYMIAIGLIISACIGGGLYYFQPFFNWNWFVGIVLFFLVLEPSIISLVQWKSEKMEKKQMVNLYMLTKVVKIIGSLIFITIYVLAEKENIKSFVTVFVLFYLLYLMAETILFVQIEKHIKKKTNNNE